MGIKIKDNDGDLTGVSKKSRKAAADKMGKVAGARADQIKSRSESGFKNEQLNDHGLPLGGSKVIQDSKYDSEGGAKFRKQKYADGVKGIKTKSRGGLVDFLNKEGVKSDTYSTKLSKMSDKDLDSEVDNQLANERFDYTKSSSGPKYTEALDSLVTRRAKKNGKLDTYSKGSKGIKMKTK